MVRLGSAVAALVAIATVMQLKTVAAPALCGRRGSTGAIAAIPYSEDMIDQYRAEGRPVFVDFTASWCVTCQFNKLTIFSKPSLAEAFEHSNAAFMVADWTLRDPEITKALEAFGANGVPLYVYYPPGDEPEVLALPLTERAVLQTVKNERATAMKGVLKMKMMIKAAAAAFVLTAPALAAPEIDALAPAFEGQTSTGETITLDQFNGQDVVLEWTNHGCPFVKRHYDSGNMQATQAAAKDKGTVWISVISSAPGKQGHVTADEANELTTSRGAQPDYVILDESGDIGRAYGAKTTPHMFLIDASGALRYDGAIDDKPTAVHAQADDAVNFLLAAVNNVADGVEVSESAPSLMVARSNTALNQRAQKATLY